MHNPIPQTYSCVLFIYKYIHIKLYIFKYVFSIEIDIFSIIHIQIFKYLRYRIICFVYNANKISMIHIIVVELPTFIHLVRIYLF